jgi:hypothetical protein
VIRLFALASLLNVAVFYARLVWTWALAWARYPRPGESWIPHWSSFVPWNTNYPMTDPTYGWFLDYFGQWLLVNAYFLNPTRTRKSEADRVNPDANPAWFEALNPLQLQWPYRLLLSDPCVVISWALATPCEWYEATCDRVTHAHMWFGAFVVGCELYDWLPVYRYWVETGHCGFDGYAAMNAATNTLCTLSIGMAFVLCVLLAPLPPIAPPADLGWPPALSIAAKFAFMFLFSLNGTLAIGFAMISGLLHQTPLFAPTLVSSLHTP